MKNIVIYTAFISCLYFGCNQSVKSDTSNTNSEEDKVISVVFNTVMGPDSYWRKNRLFPTDAISNDTSNMNVKDKRKRARYIDSVAPTLDTAKLYVAIDDTLRQLPSFGKYSIKNERVLKEIQDDSAGIDTNYKALMLKLIDSVNPRKFDISEINSIYHYTIIYESNKALIRKKNDNFFSSFPKYVIDYITFSRVVFNKEQTKSVVYINYEEGGAIYSLYKSNNSWKIRYRAFLWRPIGLIE